MPGAQAFPFSPDTVGSGGTRDVVDTANRKVKNQKIQKITIEPT
jgi:hypothetical protein